MTGRGHDRGTPVHGPHTGGTPSRGPADPGADLRAAGAALAAGRSDEAARLLEPLAAAADAAPEALALLAMLRRRQGRPEQGLALLERAVALHPGDAASWNNLGALRRESGDPAGAAAAFERALAADPESRSALYNLAAACASAQQPERAAALLERLVGLAPSDAAAWKLLGLVRTDAGAVEPAVTALERAHALAPDAPDIVNDLGVALGYAGRLDEARRSFERAVELAPDFALAWENALRSRRVTGADRPTLDHLRRLLARAPEDGMDAVYLSFALAKALDDLGETDDAFAHLDRANALMRRRAGYDPRAHDALVERIVEVCDESFVARCRAFAAPDRRPLFVVGMPRSGTTLVERVLGQAPGVHRAGELSVVQRAVARLAQAAGRPYPQALAPPAQDGASLAGFAREVSGAIAAIAPSADRVVDKMPGNYFYVGLLHALLPGARIVHCRRDPRDTGLSLYFQRFSSGHEYSYGLAHIASRYRGYRRLMAHWRALLGDSLVEVDYDELVRAPEEVSRRLLGAVGLAGAGPSASAPEDAGVVTTASSWQVRAPITRASSGRWQRYARFLGPLHELVGS